MGMVEGKVAVVTGGGSGIGRATALLLAREGARVLVADRDFAAAEATAAEAGGGAFAVRVDVTQPAEVEAMVAAAVQRFGRLDCAVNSAGVSVRAGPAGDLDEAAFAANIAVNLSGLASCVKHEIAQMLKTGGGSVVNIASGAGLEGVVNHSGYVASKHGVVGLTKCAAIDHAKGGVRINALCPGLIATPMTKAGVESGLLDIDRICPMGRAGRPEEVAEFALWLCSDRASFVTGAALPVDGGHLAW